MNEGRATDSPRLLTALLTRAPGMNFFQFCRLLEEHAPDRPGFGAQDGLWDEPVRFRSFPQMGFPAGELRSMGAEADLVDPSIGLAPSVRTTFMGLYGVDAAMPPHLLDDIVLRAEGHDVVMAFLDQFNHRLATLFYRAWKKYRYPVGFIAGGKDERSQNLLALGGFGIGSKPQQAGIPASRALSLIGLLNQRTRTGEGLAGVVSLTLPGVGARVDEFQPVWSRVTDPVGLKGRPRNTRRPSLPLAEGLGKGGVLGRRILNTSKAVKLTLYPADRHQAQALLPGGPLHRELLGMIRVYVGTKADVILRMELNSRDMPVLRLGAADGKHVNADDAEVHDGGDTGPRPRLSWTAMLKPRTDRNIEISLGRYEAFSTKSPLASPME